MRLRFTRNAEIAATLGGRAKGEPLESDLVREIVREHPPIWRTLRDNFNFHSLGFRHALRVGIIAALAGILAEQRISLEAVLQLPSESKHDLPFVITVEPTFEHDLRDAVEKMSHLDFLREPPLALPMEPPL